MANELVLFSSQTHCPVLVSYDLERKGKERKHFQHSHNLRLAPRQPKVRTVQGGGGSGTHPRGASLRDVPQSTTHLQPWLRLWGPPCGVSAAPGPSLCPKTWEPNPDPRGTCTSLEIREPRSRGHFSYQTAHLVQLFLWSLSPVTALESDLSSRSGVPSPGTALSLHPVQGGRQCHRSRVTAAVSPQPHQSVCHHKPTAAHQLILALSTSSLRPCTPYKTQPKRTRERAVTPVTLTQGTDVALTTAGTARVGPLLALSPTPGKYIMHRNVPACAPQNQAEPVFSGMLALQTRGFKRSSF